MSNLTKEQIIELRTNGLTYQAIADKAGISRQRVQQIIHPEYRREYQREYAKTPARREYQREYRREYAKTPAQCEYRREYQREYAKTPARREYQREYAKTPARREYQREYQRHRYHIVTNKKFNNCNLCKENSNE